MEANITVDFVNPPKDGKKMGSIRTKELGLVWVWADKLGQFEKGGHYTIEYALNADNDFKTFVKQRAASAVVPPPPREPPAQARSNGSHYAQPDPKERGMFIMGVVGRAMGSGQFRSDDIDELTYAAKMAWDRIIVAGELLTTPAKKELNDEIPF